MRTLEQLAYQFQHQEVSDALELVRGLLSERGAVQLPANGDGLVITDVPEKLNEIQHLLREFDHPARPLRIEIQVLRASRKAGGPSGDPAIATPELAQRLRKVLRYDFYRILSEGELDTFEGRSVRYELGSDISVSFRIGTVIQDKRVKLREFKVERRNPVDDSGVAKKTFNANLNLWLGNTLALTLAQDEESESALVVAVTCHPVE